MADYEIDNLYDFVRLIRTKLEQVGFKTELPPKDTKGYDIIALKDNELYAVQIKNYKKQVISQPQIKKFHDFLKQPENKEKFQYGLFIATTGFAKTVYSYFEAKEIKNIKLGIYNLRKREITVGTYTPPAESPTLQRARYVGVFTSKGGVGKTTISAHLAGGFAVSGYENVILLDLDVQGNLRKLLGEGVFIPQDYSKNYSGATISIFDYNNEGWSEEDANIIICDCNPDFNSNPTELIAKFDYCIVPTSLNPLGINKNADVIKRTFDEIRSINKKAKLFVLINNYYPHGQNIARKRRNERLNTILKNNFERFIKRDANCHYIDPIDDFAIRFSQSLWYWGYDTLIEEEEPCLAFKKFAGISYPKADFISLAGYIEEQTDISELKS
jgi:chromosome partitioning protein